MTTNCLTYEQLQAYSAIKVNSAERARLYMHISSCELCACAVNGFSAIPFASDELVAIHREIDAKTNATASNPLTLARVFIVAISFLFIAGISVICDNTGSKHLQPLTKKNTLPTIIKPVKHETENSSEEEISAVTKTFKKIVNVIQYEKFERNITPAERLEMIKPDGITVATLIDNEATAVTPHYNPNVIYIYDLKVSDYNKLYFGRATPEIFLLKKSIPAYRENGKSVDDFPVEEKVIPADKILKQGLASFSKQDFRAAVRDFGLLLENNPEDVNAQFYSALAYYNLNKAGLSIRYLNKVLENSSDVFYPEAQWYLALASLKNGEPENARKILQDIIAEKGFYAARAAEKLRNL